MSGRIHFVSGKTLDIEEIEFKNISPKLGAKGIRCQVSQAGHIIPLNSTTMEYIEHIEDEVKPTQKAITEVEFPKEQAEALNTKLAEIRKEKPKDPDEVLNEMLAKSNCAHENQSLYVQHTAKGIRYFPVCDFCGKRERYVSEKKIVDGEYEEWTVEDVTNAKPWID